MFLRAGLLALLLLVASRLAGLVRESAQAAAFGASAMGDVAVLMFSLPDWLTGVVAAGALSYALLPHWARLAPAEVAAVQRRVAWALAAFGVAVALGLVLLAEPAARLLVGGLPGALMPSAVRALAWSAVALPAALLAALWAARLQHERDFTGMYAANLVVNGCLIATLFAVAGRPAAGGGGGTVTWLGIGLLAAMLARLAWLWQRQGPFRVPPAPAAPGLPGAGLWLWAVLAAGLPLALPFAARSIASQGGAGALATFNYAWKLVELPLMLAVQLVATLALPAISRALATPGDAGRADADRAIRAGFALAWVLACAATAGLLLAAPAVARLLFGWGRMQPEAVAQLAAWGQVGAWSLLPQALLAVGTAVLAAQQRLAPASWAYAAALATLLALAGWGPPLSGSDLMQCMNLLLAAVSGVVLASLGRPVLAWLPWPAFTAGAGGALAALALARLTPIAQAGTALQLATAVCLAAAVIGLAWVVSADVRAALRR